MAAREVETRDVTFEIDIDPAPEEEARRAGLRYVRDDEPGYHRKRWGRGFTYMDPEGERVQEDALRERFDALAIPPAWTDVWICPDENGHIQATGRDDQGRKQYLYHPAWQRIRNETKFNRMIPFGEALTEIRERYEQDLNRRSLCYEKVIAAVVALLDRTLIRIGNRTYARQNGSFGLTTLRDRHVDFSGARCTFSFKGKSGKTHCIEFDDRRLARIVRRCRDVPGYDLFQYYDDDGARRVIESSDINMYLRETTGESFTAKDFRTWGGTVQSALVLSSMEEVEDEKQAQKNVVEMYKVVADRLGNTTAVCRQYYVHPAIVEAYVEHRFHDAWRRHLEADPPPHLDLEENATLRFLRDCLV